MSDNLFYLEDTLSDYQIRQYLSLDNFITQLSRQEYYISRKCEFEDANEAHLPLSLSFMPTLAGAQMDAKMLESIKNYDLKVTEYYNMSKGFVSCWNNRGIEDYLMWKNYATSVGVCIVSTIHHFIASFKTIEFSKYDVFAAEVRYRNFQRDDSPIDMVFTKSEHFSGESEFRFFFVPKVDNSPNTKYINLKYDSNVMVDYVILSPFIKKDTSRAIIDMLKSKFDIKAYQSSIRIK